MEEFIAAVKALYNPDQSHTAQANLFLMDLAAKPTAWSISFQVLLREDAPINSDVNCLYIAASMLYSKIRKEWRKLNDKEKADVSVSLVRIVKNGSAAPDCNIEPLSQPPQPPSHTSLMPDIIQHRLYLSLAGIALKVDNGPHSYIRVAFQIGGIEQDAYLGDPYSSIPLATYNHRMRAMLQMLSLFPEEMESADCSHAWRTELLCVVKTFFPHVMKAIDWVISSVLLSGKAGLNLNAVEGLKAAIQCFTSWVDFGTGLKDMATTRPELLRNLLNLMSGEDIGWMTSPDVALPVITSACLALERLCAISVDAAAAARQQYPPIYSEGNYTALVVDDAFLDALQKLPSVLDLASNERNEKACSAIAEVVTTFAISKMDLIAGWRNDKFLSLMEFLFILAAHRNRRVSTISLVFWLHYEHVPQSDRKFYQYERLLRSLVFNCQYPNGFTDWSKHDNTILDEDDFFQFRKGLNDVVVAISQVLDGGRFLQVLMMNPDLGGGGGLSWQVLEATLLMLKHVAKVYKTWMRAHPSQLEVLYSRQSIRDLIGKVIAMNTSSTAPLVSSHLLLRQAGHILIGCFATEIFLTTGEQDHDCGGDICLLAQCLKYVGEGLKEMQCQHHASLAFRNICICPEGGLILSTPNEVEDLLTTIEMARSAALPIEDRLLLAESISHLITELENKVETFSLILLRRFTSPILHAIEKEAISERPNLQFLRNGLCEFAQVMKFLDIPVLTNGGEQECVCVDLLRHTWPLLEHVLRRFRGDEETMMEAFGALGNVLANRSLGILLSQNMGVIALLKMISDCYFERFYPCSLDCMSVAIGVFGNNHTAEEAKHQFREFLSHANRQTFCHIQSIQLSDAQNLVQSLFDLYSNYLLFCKEAVMQDSELSNIIEFAVYCLSSAPNFEDDTLRSVIVFITKLMSCLSTGRLQQYEEETIKAVVFAKGGSIFYFIIKVLICSSGSLLWSNLIDCLYTMVKEVPEIHGQHWLHEAFTQQSNVMSSEEMLHAVKCAFRMSRQGKRRFKAILVDFIKIARLEQMPDVLLAYDMP